MDSGGLLGSLNRKITTNYRNKNLTLIQIHKQTQTFYDKHILYRSCFLRTKNLKDWQAGRVFAYKISINDDDDDMKSTVNVNK